MKQRMCQHHVHRRALKGKTMCRECLNYLVAYRTNLSKQWNSFFHAMGLDECKACGYNKCIEAIHFHHIVPCKKKIHISKLRYKQFDTKYLLEIAKCVPLCANCHIELHARNRK